MLDDGDMSKILATRGAFVGHGGRTAEVFYANLFARDPELRRLFTGEMRLQYRKLAATITLAIDGAREWDRFAPVLEVLARRHLSYGVEDRHYGLVGEALLQTLAEAGADAATLAAWARLYGMISDHMITAAYGLSRTAARSSE